MTTRLRSPASEPERLALAHESRQIAAEAERVLFHTRGRMLQSLPGFARERAALAEIAERAASLGRSLSDADARRRRALRPAPRRRAASR